MPIEV